jgi:hypothetical protein
MAVIAVCLLIASPARACVGDCNADLAVSIDELVRGVSIALGTAPMASCEPFDRNGDGRITVDELVAAVGNAAMGCEGYTQAFVVTTDYSAGSFATVGIDPPHGVMPSSPQHQIYRDAVARAHGGLVYVINRLFRDNVQVLDPRLGFKTRLQCSTGNGTNPHDIAFAAEDKAYVSRFETPKLLIVNPQAAADCHDFVRGTIDLSAVADADGNPDMDQMAIVDGRLYVALDRLNIRTILRTPAENGALAVVDTATDALLGAIELTGKNPFAATKGLTVRDGALYVNEPGYFGVLDGGIERVDLATQQAEGFVITEQELGGDITDFVLISDHLAYAIVGPPGVTNTLVAFDPTTREITHTLLTTATATLFDIELDDRGQLWVADRAARNPGVRIYRAADGTALTTTPFDLVLPPFEIVFIR